MRRVLFAMLVVLVCSGCLCGGCMCPSNYGYNDWSAYRDAERKDRERKAQPVVDALEKYKEKYGKYPEKLDDLVNEKFIDAIPNLAVTDDHQGQPRRIATAQPLEYIADGDEYLLYHAFTYVESASLAGKAGGTRYSSRYKQWYPSIIRPSPFAPAGSTRE